MELEYGFSPQQLTGRSRSHIVDVPEPPCSLHQAVVAPFMALRAAAAADGIDLMPVSSFRDFDRQLTIWNGKCRGERELRGPDGVVLDANSLGDDALVSTVLHWSALPGASRHHWGTDMDVIDAAAMPPGYRPRLETEEFAAGGVFARLDAWLAERSAELGFYRPYGSYRGGFQPEPWHLSYAPVASQALAQFSVQLLQAALDQIELAASAAVRRALPRIVETYVMNVDAAPAGAIRATRLA
ncbi:MAG: M15 family metallopeptidase [Steroidobacteraceae bacterium]